MTPDAVDPVWVIGAGGLLGKAVIRRCRELSIPVHTTKVPWQSAAHAVSSLSAAGEELFANSHQRWTIIWCAGAGVTSTSDEALDAELDVLRRTLDNLAQQLSGRRLIGTFFLASSAGGVYAGSTAPPFDESTEPSPLASYGNAKLRAEALVSAFCRRTFSKGVVGRFSNLYGPGQNLSKAQGLISVLVKSVVTGQPVKLYVSMDTLRDYLFVDDAAKLVLDSLRRANASDVMSGSTTTKIMASHRADSISSLVGATRTVLKRGALLTIGASPHARAQAPDLRMRSIVWPELDAFSKTPLSAGIHATASDMMTLRMSGAMSPLGAVEEPK